MLKAVVAKGQLQMWYQLIQQMMYYSVIVLCRVAACKKVFSACTVVGAIRGV
jgi:hypothetical protein